MPLRNHSAWLQHGLPNERLLTNANSGPEKCVLWQMQVLVTKRNVNTGVFSQNLGVPYIYIYT